MQKSALIIALIVGTTFFMENVDGTAITTAIPQMSHDFGVSPVTMSMGITAYVIMLAVFIPISGWFAERYGTRTIFVTAIAGFVISSILCGLSESLPTFVGARILQGFFGAMMVPVGQLAVLGNTEKKDLVTAIALITWPGLAGPICGPFIGGYFTTYHSWHWIFFINIPLGIIAILLSLKYVPNKIYNKNKPLDWKGFVLSGIGLLLFMIGLEIINGNHGNIYLIIGILSLAFLSFGISVWHSFKTDLPLINYSVFKIKTYKITSISGSITKVVINTAPYLLPLFFQLGFGLSAFNAGLLYMASMVGNLAMKPATIWITRKYNFKQVLIINGLILSVSIFIQGYFEPTTPYALIAGILFISGLSRSMQFSSLTTLAYSDVPKDKMSNANTLYNTLQQLSVAVGITTGSILLHFSALYHGNHGTYQVVDFQLALKLSAIIGIFCLFEFFQLNKNDGLNVRVKKKKI